MKYSVLIALTGLLWSVSVDALPPGSGRGVYGPIKANETLWSIANHLRPAPGVSAQQMMFALYRKNPQAFAASNINSLQKGVYLQLPVLSEIRQLSRGQALQRARQHNRSWRSAALPVRKVSSPPRRSEPSRKVLQALQSEIADLRSRLESEHRRSQRLQAQVNALQAMQNRALPPPEKDTPEIQKLRAEVSQLKTLLVDKDNHIQNLQTALTEASKSIKRQYAENQELYKHLQASNPQQASTKSADDGKPRLTLTGVDESESAQPPVSASPFKDGGGGTAPPPASDPKSVRETINGKELKENTPLSSLLEPPPSRLEQTAGNGQETRTKRQRPSVISFGVALFSLLFILTLLWRAFRRKHEERSGLKKAADAPAPSDAGGLKDNTDDPLSRHADGRRDPDIIF